MHWYRRFAFIILAALAGQWVMSQDWPAPEKGVLDLRDMPVDMEFLLKLDGEWEFYWERFIAPIDFYTGNAPEPTLYVRVPSYWQDHPHDEIEFPGTGYATYRMRILLPEGFEQDVGLDIPAFDVSIRAYLDGHEIFSSGKPGISEELSEPDYMPRTIIFQPDREVMEIILHVSNFQHRRGAFWKSMQLGSSGTIIKIKQRYRLIGSITLGMLLAFSLFFFFFYVFYRKDKIVLSFSFVLAGVFIRMLNTDLYPINYIIDIPWDWIIRLEYLGTFLAFGAALWYFHRLFPAKYMLWFARINTYLTIVAALVILFFKVRVFAWTMMFFQPAVVILLVYYLVACTLRAIKGERTKAVFLAGMLIFLGGLVNDLLVANSVQTLTRDYVIHFTLQIFVFIQAVLIIRSWIRAYIERERLMEEIAYINKNLEELVEERTTEINNRNKELNEALELKSRLFSIIAHDLKSPVASLVQNSALLDYNLGQEDNKKLINSFRELSRSALNLIDNLLYWGRSQGAQIQYNPESFDAKPVIEELMKLFGEVARQKNISLDFEVIGNTNAFADKELLEITLRNLVSNAIKFTREGGNVKIIAGQREDSGTLELSVIDNGIGIPAARLENILEDPDLKSTVGTQKEKGTGLGLKLCSELLQVNNGEMIIESKEGEGTAVKVRIPATKEKA